MHNELLLFFLCMFDMNSARPASIVARVHVFLHKLHILVVLLRLANNAVIHRGPPLREAEVAGHVLNAVVGRQLRLDHVPRHLQVQQLLLIHLLCWAATFGHCHHIRIAAATSQMVVRVFQKL